MRALTVAFVAAVCSGLGCQSAGAQPAVGAVADSANAQTATFHVEGMACERCSGRLRAVLLKLDGVIAADADHEAKRVVVRFDPSRVTIARVKQEIEAAGFEVGS